MTKTLAEMRAVPHLSVSQLKVFVQCPRKYKLQYVDRVEPQFLAGALVFGTAWHEAVGHHLMTSTPAAPADRDEVKEVFRERLAIAVEGDRVPVLFDDDADLASTVDMGTRMLDVFLDRVPVPERVIGVEVAFSLELVEPEYGDVLKTPLIGALDAIVVNGGVPEVWELKSGKKKFGVDQLQYDLQPTAYAAAAGSLGYTGADVVLLLTTKTKAPDVQVERFVRSKADQDDLAATATAVATAIAVGIDHPVRGWACRGCPFAHACR